MTDAFGVEERRKGGAAPHSKLSSGLRGEIAARRGGWAEQAPPLYEWGDAMSVARGITYHFFWLHLVSGVVDSAQSS